MKWLVEVDVVGFYDNIDHSILLDLLREKIDDERLIGLVGRMLKAGYMEDWTFHETFSGTPQGGVISPILANVYLHALDAYMEEKKAAFDKGRRRRDHPEWRVYKNAIDQCRRKINLRKSKGKEEEIPGLLRTIKELEQQRREVPAKDGLDPDYRRLLYCRYADDFLIGVIGSKEDARGLMAEVQRFLADRLRLRASEEKSGIRKASDGADFLGYTVKTYRSPTLRRQTFNGGRRVTTRPGADRVQLRTPPGKLAGFVERKRLGSYHSNRGDMRAELTNHSDLAILAGYNAMMRGLAEYYKLGTFWDRELGRVYHVWWWSLHKTLARKHKCSVAQVAQKLQHGERRGLWYDVRGKRQFMAVYRLKDTTAAPVKYGAVDRVPQEVAIFATRNDLIDRLKERTCTACGNRNVPTEVHHVRRVEDLATLTFWTRMKAMRARKRVVLCRDCHDALHAGRLQARLDAMTASVGAG